MKKLDRFILKSFIGPFVGILFVVIFILMMQFLWLYIDELVGKGLTLGIILEFLLWGGCTIFPLALPLATLLASLMTLGSMTENNELLALRSAGIPLTRIMTPLATASVIISIGAFFAGNNLVPKAYNEIYTLRDDIGRTKSEIKIPSGVFYEGIEGYVLRIEKQDKKTGMMHGVMVYNHTKPGGNVSVTLADSAMMKLSKNKDYLTFTLHKGSSYQENNRMGRDTLLDLQRLDFDKQELVIPLKNYSFEKSDSVRFDDQVKSMRLGQLTQMNDSLKIVTAENKKYNYENFIHTDEFRLFSQLDTSRKNGATHLFERDGFMEWDDATKLSHCYGEAGDKAAKLRDKVANYAMAEYSERFYITHSDVEILKKFAQALACLLLFFIGAPLGALIGKGGLGASAIVATLFFVLYWVIDISGTKLASDGAVSAFAGVFISAFVLAPIGGFLTWKATHDNSLTSMENIKTWWRKFKSRIARFFRPVRIVYMGTPEFAVAPLDKLISNGYKVVGVVTVADKPSGRGLKVNQSAVKQYAVEHGIPVLQPLKLKDPEFLAQLKALKGDLFVVVAFRMLPREVWDMPKLGTFNLHAALLPQYRGAAPINWAVINGEKRTGVTSFMLDEHIDTGAILLREECPIGPEETAGDVHDKLMELGSEVVLQTVEGLIQHNLEPRVQRAFIQGDKVLMPAPKLTPEICRIDWNRKSTEIYNQIRGLSPYPSAWTELEKDGEKTQLKIFFGRISERRAEPGQILSDGKSYLAIGTGDGALEVTDIQLAGKKRMEVKAFLAGFREPEQYKAV